MEVISSANDGEDTEYGLIINQEELDVLVFILGSFSMKMEEKIGLPKNINMHMFTTLCKYRDENKKFKRFRPIIEEDLI